MKKGFTLAEVLITLGIIGVIAALTLPNLVAKYKHQEAVAQLKKIYSEMSQAMLLAFPENDFSSNDIVDGSSTALANWFNSTLGKQFNIIKMCVDESGCWNDGAKSMNGSAIPYDRGNIGIGYGIIIFDTNSGYFVNLDVYSPNDVKNIFGVNTESDAIAFFVDVNGSKQPNTIGKDIYILVYTKERGLVPAGRNQTTTVVTANCKPDDNGYFCLEHILRNGWIIDKDNVW